MPVNFDVSEPLGSGAAAFIAGRNITRANDRANSQAAEYQATQAGLSQLGSGIGQGFSNAGQMVGNAFSQIAQTQFMNPIINQQRLAFQTALNGAIGQQNLGFYQQQIAAQTQAQQQMDTYRNYGMTPQQLQDVGQSQVATAMATDGGQALSQQLGVPVNQLQTPLSYQRVGGQFIHQQAQKSNIEQIAQEAQAQQAGRMAAVSPGMAPQPMFAPGDAERVKSLQGQMNEIMEDETLRMPERMAAIAPINEQYTRIMQRTPQVPQPAGPPANLDQLLQRSGGVKHGNDVFFPDGRGGVKHFKMAENGDGTGYAKSTADVLGKNMPVAPGAVIQLGKDRDGNPIFVTGKGAAIKDIASHGSEQSDPEKLVAQRGKEYDTAFKLLTTTTVNDETGEKVVKAPDDSRVRAYLETRNAYARGNSRAEPGTPPPESTGAHLVGRLNQRLQQDVGGGQQQAAQPPSQPSASQPQLFSGDVSKLQTGRKTIFEADGKQYIGTWDGTNFVDAEEVSR